MAPYHATYCMRDSLLGNKTWMTFEEEKYFRNNFTVGLINIYEFSIPVMPRTHQVYLCGQVHAAHTLQLHQTLEWIHI